MVTGLPDVQADEHVNVPLGQNHRNARSLVRTLLTRAGRSKAARGGIHVTKRPGRHRPAVFLTCLY
jgi:hypothetical protein